MIPQNPILAAEHRGAPTTYGDGGLAQFHQMYFNGRNVAGYDHRLDRMQRRDHFQLTDNNKGIFEDAGKVIRNISFDHLSWINRDLMPAEITRVIEEEITVINFDDGVTPEQTPNEAVSRYLDIRREKINFRSKRYGLAMYFEVDRMMTDEGKEDFAMFAKKIAVVFRIHAAYIALARLLQPSLTEAKWYSQYGKPSAAITEQQRNREVSEFAIAHKSDTGAMAIIWTYAKAFEMTNGVKPDLCIFHPEKQALFKFNSPILNEYSRGGPNAPDRVMGYDEIARFSGISARGFPAFPKAVYNGQDEVELSMNAHDVEIGNMFIFRRSAFMNFKNFTNGVHNYINIFSENKDGMHRIYERELLLNCFRWDSDGFLDEHHNKVARTYRPTQPGEDVDMFFYYDRDMGKYNVCNYIGDMEPKHLDRSLLMKMVGEILTGIDKDTLAKYRDDLGRTQELISNGVGAVPQSQDHVHRLVEYAQYLSRRLGGYRNPVFDSNRLRDNDMHGFQIAEAERSALVFLDNCMFYSIRVAGQVHAPGQAAEDVLETDLSLMKRNIRDRVIRSTTLTDDQIQSYVNLERHVEHFYSHFMLADVSAPWFTGLKEVFVRMIEIIAYPNRPIPNEVVTQLVTDFNEFVTTWDITGEELAVTNTGDLLTAIRALMGRCDTLTGDDAQRAATRRAQAVDPERVAFNAQGEARRNPRATAGLNLHTVLTGLAAQAATAGPQRPFHFTGYQAPPTRRVHYHDSVYDDHYDVARGQFDEPSAFTMRGTSMQANVTYVIEAFVDPIERAAALALLATPIHREVFDTMLSFNIQLPCEYVLLRPWAEYLMSDIILCRGGRDLGVTKIGYGHTSIGWKVVNKTGDLHSTQWMGAVVRDYSLRCIIRNVFHERAYGGAGHKFFNDVDLENHIESGFHTEGYDRPSLLCAMIPVGSYVRDNYVNLLGRNPGQDVKTQLHYASAVYYTARFELHKIVAPGVSVVTDQSIPRVNTICYQGTQEQCGNLNGDPGERVENQGHLGVERTGDKEVRMHGIKLKPIVSQHA